MASLGGPDELHKALGLAQDEPPIKPGRDIPYGKLALSGCALVALSLVAFVQVTSSERSGEPFATARIETLPKPEAPPKPAVPAPGDDQTASIEGGRRELNADQIEAKSGVKVNRQGGHGTGALIIQVEEALGVHLNPAPDKRLIEKTTAGLLPKIGADGAKAAEVYARPMLTGGKIKLGAPRIAIIVGGLGLDPQGTAEAIASLPGAVTLGFAPYGPDLDKQVAHARDDGHEIVLQVPMEPFDYPANDPGPHTLTTTAAPAQTLDHLRWHLARFTGYVGVSNYLGGKFMADQTAFSAALREISGRGLIFVDDGASPRSLTAQLSASLGVSAVAADVAIDADPRPEAIDAALIKLETIARAKGHATGTAQALPLSVEKIARFARALEGRGIALAPASVIAGKLSVTAAQ